MVNSLSTVPESSVADFSSKNGGTSPSNGRQRGSPTTVSWWFIVGVVLGFFCWGGSPFRPSHLDVNTSMTTTAKLSGEPSNKHPLVMEEWIGGGEAGNAVQALWAQPHDEATIDGILFLAHGCGHSNTDWFENCPGCLGLPEEVAIVETALNHGLAVVAVSSQDRDSKCWSVENDTDRVRSVLEFFSRRLSNSCLGVLPVYAFGASSGGAFVSEASQKLGLDGFISQISAVSSGNLNDSSTSPCQVYITMSKDEGTDQQASHLVTRASKAPAVQARHISVPPVPIDAYFFSSRIPSIDVDQSKALTKALQSKHFLDDKGYLVEDPRTSEWRKILSAPAKKLPFQDSLKADQSPISEILNVAYGMHEMTRDGVQTALDFCAEVPSASDEEQASGGKNKKKRKKHKEEKPTGPLYYKEPWDKWPEEVQAAAKFLGYDKEMWENDETAEEVDKSWKHLSKAQQNAAAKLGYTRTSWDAD